MSLWQLLFSFDGRVRRLHWWLTRLGVGFGFLLLFGIVAAIGSGLDAASGGAGRGGADLLGLIAFLIALPVVIWIELAITIKRWHDRDKPGVMVLVALIPLIGGFWTLIECGFLDGTPGQNRYGPSPKGLGMDHVFS